MSSPPISSDEVNACDGCPEYWDCFNAINDGCQRPNRICKVVEGALNA